MRCDKHPSMDINFVCTNYGCDNMPLCESCRREHIDQNRQSQINHNAFITPLRKMLQAAQDNLRKQKDKIEQIIKPFQDERKIVTQIKKQKQMLQKECDRIKGQIDKRFKLEIKKLEDQNSSHYERNREQNLFEDLENKKQEIEELMKSFRNNSSKLKKSLVYSVDQYIRKLGSLKSPLNSLEFHKINEYYLYDNDSIKHKFTLDPIYLQKKTIGGKPLTKVFNQSPLYILINQKTSDTLFYFSPNEKVLRTYNVKHKNWKTYHSQIQIPSFGCSIHDYQSDKFYYFGGITQGRSNKSAQIICFDRNNKLNHWSILQSTLQVARSSAMCVLIKHQDNGQPNKVLIVGGMDNSGVVLKSCQLFTPSTNPDYDNSSVQLLKCSTNFGTCSGTLVNFNNNIIFKIGGLGNSNRQHVICEMAQKLDFEKYQIQNTTKWNYIEIEDVLGRKQSDYKLFYAGQCGIQVNPNQIFVFGGCSHNNEGIRESYVLQVETITNSDKKVSSRYYARMINDKALLTGEGFGDLKAITWEGKVYALQNISSEGKSNQVLEKEKRILQFNMYQWFETDCIISQ